VSVGHINPSDVSYASASRDTDTIRSSTRAALGRIMSMSGDDMLTASGAVPFRTGHAVTAADGEVYEIQDDFHDDISARRGSYMVRRLAGATCIGQPIHCVVVTARTPLTD